jgi:hypothetical protein
MKKLDFADYFKVVYTKALKRIVLRIDLHDGKGFNTFETIDMNTFKEVWAQNKPLELYLQDNIFPFIRSERISYLKELIESQTDHEKTIDALEYFCSHVISSSVFEEEWFKNLAKNQKTA